MFWILTSLIAALVIAATAFAFLRTGDAFHPLVYLGPMLLFIYCVMPWMAAADGRLYDYLPDSLLGLAQAIHLAGVASLVAGVLAGGGRARSPARRRVVLPLRVWRLALGAGLLGLGSFIYGITSVGGLSEAYGRAYGGGWAASGYVRDLTHFALPAAVYLIAPATGVSRKLRYVAVAMVVSPIAIHGLLGARRGPTFMVVVGLTIAWFMTRGVRPRIPYVLGGGLALGLGLVLLLANRHNIYLGSDWALDSNPGVYLEASGGNEFVYSAGLVADSWTRENYGWGRRYAVELLVRPVPRALWPDKYEAASRVFGIASVEENAGLAYQEMRHTVGWEGTAGAAPGVVADMWVEFWWFSVAVLFLIGFLYGKVWTKSVIVGGPWTISYAILAALSAYLVVQTLEAWAYRLLVMGAAALAIWRVGRGRSRGRAPVPSQALAAARDSLP